jgi:serine/threonine protein kinase
MGEVYKARDTRLDRIVAIKVLPEVLAGDPQFRERFDREARAISQLTHPHICTLYDIGESVGTAFLVMEYLEGETLEQRLKKGAVPLDEALKIAIQIADALSFAHRHGIVHRDLKPGNVMLTKGHAKNYGIDMLVYFEIFDSARAAIQRGGHLRRRRHAQQLDANGAEHPRADVCEAMSVGAFAGPVVTHQPGLLEAVADEFVWMDAGKIIDRTSKLRAGTQ